MALADDIHALTSRTLSALNEAYDYYTDTKLGWDIVRFSIQAGASFSERSAATGTVTTESDLIHKSNRYVAEFLKQATFQQFISTFEAFLLDLLRLWLLAYPRSLKRKQIDFESILDAPDKDAIALLVVNKELLDVFYRKPADWFDYLRERTGIAGPTADEVERFSEAKATRDVLVHNQGVANKTYVQKAGRLARYAEGEPIDLPEPYHREVWELLRKLTADADGAAAAKAV